MGQQLGICAISDDFLPAATGVGIHLQLVLPELARRGHRVSIITTRRRDEPATEVWNGVQIYRTATVKVYGFYQAIPTKRTIRRILEAADADIVHYHYLGLLLMRAFHVAEHLKLRHIYTYHMTVDHLTQPLLMRPYRPLIARIYRRYCNRFDLVLSPSSALVPQIQSTGVTTPIRYLSNPIAFKAADYIGGEENAGFVVLFVGRLDPEKNIGFLLRAFAKVKASEPEAQLWIAGAGGGRAELERLTERLDLGGSVRFLGFVRHLDLPQVYGACDVFVLPSLVETQGMVALEAMRFAKPVVVSDTVVSAAELVSEGENGFIVPANDVERLAERLITLAQDEGLRARMGAMGRSRSEMYTPAAIVDALEQHYLSAL